MRSEQNLKRLEQGRRLFSAQQHFGNLFLVAVRHRGNDRLFVFEIAINESDADPSLGADIVHAGLVKTTLGEANHGGLHDLLATILAGVYLEIRHKARTMNERSFIVKPPPLRPNRVRNTLHARRLDPIQR